MKGDLLEAPVLFSLVACSLVDILVEEPVAVPADVEAPAAVAVTLDGTSEVLGGTRFRMPQGAIDVAFGPDDSWLLLLDEGGTLHRFSLPEGEPTPVQDPCDSEAQSIALSPDGTRLAVSCEYDSVRLVDLASGRTLKNLPGGADRLRWSEDGAVIGASWDEQLRFLDATTGRVLDRVTADWDADWDNHGAVWAIVNAGEAGEVLDTGSPGAGRSLVVLEPGKGERLRQEVGEASAVALSRDGKQVVVLNDDRLRAFDSHSGERVLGHPLEDTWLVDLVRTASNWWAVGEGRVMQLDERLEVMSFVAGSYDVLRASPSGTWVVGLGASRPGVWRHDGEVAVADDGLPNRADLVSTSDDGQVVAGASWDGTVYWVDRRTDASHTLQVRDNVTDLQVAPDGQSLTVVDYDAIRVVTVADGTQHTVDLDDDQPSWIGYAPDSAVVYILHGWESLTLSAVDPRSGQVRTTRTLARDATGEGAHLSPDGSTLVVPMDNGQLRVVEL